MKKLSPRFIFVYSDTQLLEIYQGIHLAIVNPIQLFSLHAPDPKCHNMFIVMGIFSIICGLFYTLSTFMDNLKVRMYSSLTYWLICCSVMALLIQCHAILSYQFLVGYSIQMFFAFFIHSRLTREYTQRIKNGKR